MRYKRLLTLFFAGMLLFSVFSGRVYAVGNVYEVQKGDCLWKIAERLLGDGAAYMDIVAWNRELIRDPNLIFPGVELRIAANTGAGEKNGGKTTEETVQETSGQSSGEALVGSYLQGVVSGTSWESEWLGMSLELPEGFAFKDVEKFIDELDNISEDDDLSDDSEEQADLEFVVINPSSLSDSTIFLAVQQWDGSVDECMEELKAETEEQVMESFGVEMNWSDEGTAVLGGRSFEHYYGEEDYMGFPVCQHYYITKVDDRIVLLFMLYIGDMEKENEAFLDGFSTVSKVADAGERILSETMKTYEEDGTLMSTAVYENGYDNAGNRVRRTEYNSDGIIARQYNYEFDNRGNITVETLAVEYVDTWETSIYKDDGELLENVWDGKGMPGHGGETRAYRWTYRYDEYDNIAQTLYETSEGEQRLTIYEYEYDTEGNVLKQTSYEGDPDGGKSGKTTGWTEYSYDKENRMTESISYDSDGKRSSRNTFEYAVDHDGNMTTSTHFEDGAIIWFTTDSKEILIDGGYQSSSGSSPDFASLYEYDGRGNLSRVTDYRNDWDVMYYTTWEYKYETD